MPKNEMATAYVMETAKGEFLQVLHGPDGNAISLDFTNSIWEAYWGKSKDCLEGFTGYIDDGFKRGYPKYHKVRLSCEFVD